MANNRSNINIRTRNPLFAICLILCLILIFISAGNASAIVIADGNTELEFNPNSPNSFHRWSIEGTDIMNHSGLYLRIGNSAETPLSALTFNSAVTTDTNSFDDTRDDAITLGYTDPQNQFNVTVKYSLFGGQAGSNLSNISQIVTINNLTQNVLNLSIYEVNDLNLINNGLSDSVVINNGNTANYINAQNVTVASHNVTPAPTGVQGDSSATLIGLMNNLTDDNLNNQLNFGPGDAAFAWQWDISIAPNGSFILSENRFADLNVVPEPTSLAFLGLASVLLMGKTRRNA